MGTTGAVGAGCVMRPQQGEATFSSYRYATICPFTSKRAGGLMTLQFPGFLVAPTMAAVLVVASAAAAQETERSFGLLDGLFGSSERVAPSAPPERSPPSGQNRFAQAPGAGDLAVRIDRLEGHIRQLT